MPKHEQMGSDRRRGFFLILDSLKHLKDSAQDLDIGVSWLASSGNPKSDALSEIQSDMDKLIGRLALEISKEEKR